MGLQRPALRPPLTALARAPGLVLHKEPLSVSRHLPRTVGFLFMVVKHTTFTGVTTFKCTVHSRRVAITTIVSGNIHLPTLELCPHPLPVSTNLTALRALCKELYSVCRLLPDLFPEHDGLKLHVTPCVRRSFLFWAE